MCGRYTLTPGIYDLLDQMGFPGLLQDYGPRFNVAPTQMVPVLRLDGEGNRQVELFKWGLIPSWAKDPDIGNRLINARSETITEKPSFRSAFGRRRCVILTDGWYEWMKTPAGKQPVRIRLAEGRAFGFAGLWEHWEPKEGGDGISSCTIITADAAPAIEKIHHRMPCLLTAGEWDAWLAPDASKEMLLAMLGPYRGDDLEFYAVSKDVNSPKNDRPEVIEPTGEALDP